MKPTLIGAVAAALLLAHPVHAQLAEPNDAGVAFGHVHLYVQDVDLHGRLWTELFDGTLASKDRFTWVRLPGTLIFLTQEDSTTPSAGTTIDHFGLTVRDLDALLDAWRELSYEVDSTLAGPGGAPRAFITMPGGLRLELREDPDARAAAVMDHVHFYAQQNRELLEWYDDIFGAARPDSVAAGVGGAPRAEVPGSALVFGRSEEDRPGTEGTVINHYGFEVEDIDSFAGMLRTRGVEFKNEPFYVEVLDLWVSFIYDPAGALVEISEGLDHL